MLGAPAARHLHAVKAALLGGHDGIERGRHAISSVTSTTAGTRTGLGSSSQASAAKSSNLRLADIKTADMRLCRRAAYSRGHAQANALLGAGNWINTSVCARKRRQQRVSFKAFRTYSQ